MVRRGRALPRFSLGRPGKGLPAGASGNNLTSWPSAANRPTISGSTLSWVGPTLGGSTSADDVPQSVALTASGSFVTSADGQTVEGLNIGGDGIEIRHSNVTLRRCRINTGNFYTVFTNNVAATGLVIEDCLMDGNGTAAACILPEMHGAIIRRCNLTNAENGIFIGGNNLQVRDCYIHDLNSAAADPHYDGIQGTGGFTSLTIDHNAIWGRDTSCIILQNEGGGFSGAVINNNLLVMQDGSSAIYCNNTKGPGLVDSITITNNRLGKGGFYNSIEGVTNLTYTGNVDYLTSAPVSSSE